MSALDGWIDVCRAGTWRDMAGRKVAIDEARLDRIVAAYARAGPAPVVVGHPETDAPAHAWIDALRRSGDRLQARLRDIAPAFRQAVEAGRYASRSIALQGDTLRHLGFLGGRTPAVPGLAPTRFAGAAETVIALAEGGAAERASASIAKAEERLREIETKGRARAKAGGSNAAIAASARRLVAGSDATLSLSVAVDQARAEAGIGKPGGPTDAAIAARARQLMAASGGRLNAIVAVDQARAESATLGSRERATLEQEAMERRHAQWDRVAEAIEDTADALERRLVSHARALIAAARRAIASDPFQARELALRAREAMEVISPLHGKTPDHGPARRILEAARGRAA